MSALEQDQIRNSRARRCFDAEGHADCHRPFIFTTLRPAVVGACQFLDDRRDCFARATPRSPEVDQHWHWDGFQYLLIERDDRSLSMILSAHGGLSFPVRVSRRL